MRDIKDFTLEELEGVLKGRGLPAFHAKQIFSWVYKKGASDFLQMSDLPAPLRKRLKEDFYIYTCEVARELKSIDGTEKLLFKLKDKNYIEGVIIPAEGRITGCVSSQIGCKFACSFCASGLAGFKRNLTAGEILEQVLFLKTYAPENKLTHIVFMGTGEPFDNYDNVMKAARIINSEYAFNIGARRISISTNGVVPGIEKLAAEKLQLELSVSLHAAFDKTRSALMPINKKYPLKELLSACKDYIKKTGRLVTFEYILIKGVNSGLKDAKNLSKMLKGLRLYTINLIPANAIKELNIYPPNNPDILIFRSQLFKQGLNAILRKSRGQDIEAACGQLRFKIENETINRKA